MPCVDARDLPPEPPETAEPNGTRDLTEAVINAAVRHGSDGHGRDGLTGYMGLLEATEPRAFSRLAGVAQRWQTTSRPDKPKKPELSEEKLREVDKILEAGRIAKYGEWGRTRTRGEFEESPYTWPEDDPYRMKD